MPHDLEANGWENRGFCSEHDSDDDASTSLLIVVTEDLRKSTRYNQNTDIRPGSTRPGI